MMRFGRRLIGILAAGLLLTACEPAELELTYRSPRRLDQHLVAEVPSNDAELVEALLGRVVGGGWRVHRRDLGDNVRLTLDRRLDPREFPAIEASRKVIGPLGLRVEYTLTYPNPFADLAPDDIARQGLRGQKIPVALRVRMPGRILLNSSSPGATGGDDGVTWAFDLAAVAAEPTQFAQLTVQSRAWRLWLLILIAALAALMLWILWPVLFPTGEAKALRDERREQRRARRDEQREAAARKRAEKAAAKEAAAAKKQAAEEEKRRKKEAAAAKKQAVEEQKTAAKDASAATESDSATEALVPDQAANPEPQQPPVIEAGQPLPPVETSPASSVPPEPAVVTPTEPERSSRPSRGLGGLKARREKRRQQSLLRRRRRRR